MALALMLACQKAEEASDDIPEESLASETVPIAAVNLTFSIDDEELDDIDAYVVGYPEKLEAEQIGTNLYTIGVPKGKQEIIITGSKDEAAEGFTHGLRFPIEVNDPTKTDLGRIEVPEAAKTSGLLAMDGTEGFEKTSQVFQGTKLAAVSPDSYGNYTIERLPIGSHTVTTDSQLGKKAKIVLREGDTSNQAIIVV